MKPAKEVPPKLKRASRIISGIFEGVLFKQIQM
jgi:hypothetical protein